MITSDFRIVPEHSAPNRLRLAISQGAIPNVAHVDNVSDGWYTLLNMVRTAVDGAGLLEICYPLRGCSTTAWPCAHDTRTINASDLCFTRSRNWVVKGTRTDSGDARSYRLDVVAYVRRIEPTTGNVVESWGYEPTTGNFA